MGMNDWEEFGEIRQMTKSCRKKLRRIFPRAWKCSLMHWWNDHDYPPEYFKHIAYETRRLHINRSLLNSTAFSSPFLLVSSYFRLPGFLLQLIKYASPAMQRTMQRYMPGSNCIKCILMHRDDCSGLLAADYGSSGYRTARTARKRIKAGYSLVAEKVSLVHVTTERITEEKRNRSWIVDAGVGIGARNADKLRRRYRAIIFTGIVPAVSKDDERAEGRCGFIGVTYRCFSRIAPLLTANRAGSWHDPVYDRTARWENVHSAPELASGLSR